LNLSITSFDKKIASCYQNVDPNEALKALKKFPAKMKNLNIIIVEANYKEITDIIKRCISESISIDLMFELKEYTEEDQKMQMSVFKELEDFIGFDINLRYTPVITHIFNENCRLRIKHPHLSSLLHRKICSNCAVKRDCFERICAVRVYPDSTVSACLNQTLTSNAGSLDLRISDIYERISEDFSLFDFLSFSSGTKCDVPQI
jgi:hypothetical protein